jgi:hypothetical protein
MHDGLSDELALGEMHELLRQSCQQQAPFFSRLAVRYQICRSALLSAGLKPYLPGFLMQCVSLIKFREFICLYDHDPVTRERFIDGALENCWTKLDQNTEHDTSAPDDVVRVTMVRRDESRAPGEIDDFMAGPEVDDESDFWPLPSTPIEPENPLEPKAPGPSEPDQALRPERKSRGLR